MDEINFLLKKYRIEFLTIDGAETHIIDPNSMEALVNDRKLLEMMHTQRKYLMPYMDIISSMRNADLYLGILHNSRYNGIQWLPVLCLMHNNRYYHVIYQDNWKCMHCGHTVERVLMPFSEGDNWLFAYQAHRIPPVADVFKKINCPKCGSLLQGHLMLSE